jgi:hypothetical protein
MGLRNASGVRYKAPKRAESTSFPKYDRAVCLIVLIEDNTQMRAGTVCKMLGPPPPHRSLWRALLAGGAVIGFAMLGAVILYLVTIPL